MLRVLRVGKIVYGIDDRSAVVEFTRDGPWVSGASL